MRGDILNRHVMGKGVLDTAGACRVYDEMRADPRVTLLSQRRGFDEPWRRIGMQTWSDSGPWTDSYLTAFASHIPATLVTFDCKFEKTGGSDVVTLFTSWPRPVIPSTPIDSNKPLGWT